MTISTESQRSILWSMVAEDDASDTVRERRAPAGKLNRSCRCGAGLQCPRDCYRADEHSWRLRIDLQLCPRVPRWHSWIVGRCRRAKGGKSRSSRIRFARDVLLVASDFAVGEPIPLSVREIVRHDVYSVCQCSIRAEVRGDSVFYRRENGGATLRHTSIPLMKVESSSGLVPRKGRTWLPGATGVVVWNK